MVTSLPSSYARSGTSWIGLKNLFLLGLMVAIGATVAPVADAETPPPRLRVVFEMTNGSEAAFDAFVANVEGLQKHSGNLADITVVAFSQGVGLLRGGDEPLQQRLTKLADRGVDFVVCEAGLKEAEGSGLLGFARTVRSGSEEVDRLESQGWARVRDGESYVSHL